MLLHPTYFPNLSHFIVLLNGDGLRFEVCDNYQKQTYRNRCEIYAANGKLSLTVPVNYTQKQRRQFKDVKIANIENWQLQHLKSLESAYRMSPFFEFYIDELMPIFTTTFDKLLDLNINCFDTICQCLDLEVNYNITDTYKTDSDNDYRYLVNAKNNKGYGLKPYIQVFSEKYGHIPNLSILDLLFNEGPNALNYLEKQTIIKKYD